MHIVEGCHPYGDRGARNGQARRPGFELGEAVGKACGREAQVKLSVVGGEIPDGRGEEAAWGEVAGWKRDLGGGVARFGDQAAVQLVEGGGEPGEVVGICAGCEVDVERVVAAAVRLDRGSADQDEQHLVSRQHAEQRLTSPVGGRGYATGVCWLSHAWIFSSSLRFSGGASRRARWTSSTAW